MHSSSLTMHDARLFGLYQAMSQLTWPALRIGIITVILQIHGQSAYRNGSLKMPRKFRRATGPRALKNNGRIPFGSRDSNRLGNCVTHLLTLTF